MNFADMSLHYTEHRIPSPLQSQSQLPLLLLLLFWLSSRRDLLLLLLLPLSFCLSFRGEAEHPASSLQSKRPFLS